jgi:hypothetical protein
VRVGKPFGALGVLVAIIAACGGKTLGGDGMDDGGGASSGGASSGGTPGSGASSGGTPASNSSAGGGSSSGPPGRGVDASAPRAVDSGELDAIARAADASRVTCSTGAGGGSSGAGSCLSQATEMCTDGLTYQVSCSCPASTCECFASSTVSGSSGVIKFSSCPACPSLDEMWMLCAFPH